MELLTGSEIRDFRIRGNYANQRSLLSRVELHPSKEQKAISIGPGYSPPVVEFDLHGGSSSSIIVSEIDIPSMCNGDIEKAKKHLALILDARRGDPEAAKCLSSTAQEHLLAASGQLQPSESAFVVPCTSSQPHSEHAISQKAFTLLKLCHLGYPVPDFVVLTAHAYEDRDQHLEEHLADALKQLETLTMQDLG